MTADKFTIPDNDDRMPCHAAGATPEGYDATDSTCHGCGDKFTCLAAAVAEPECWTKRGATVWTLDDDVEVAGVLGRTMPYATAIDRMRKRMILSDAGKVIPVELLTRNVKKEAEVVEDESEAEEPEEDEADDAHEGDAEAEEEETEDEPEAPADEPKASDEEPEAETEEEEEPPVEEPATTKAPAKKKLVRVPAKKPEAKAKPVKAKPEPKEAPAPKAKPAKAKPEPKTKTKAKPAPKSLPPPAAKGMKRPVKGAKPAKGGKAVKVVHVAKAAKAVKVVHVAKAAKAVKVVKPAKPKKAIAPPKPRLPRTGEERTGNNGKRIPGPMTITKEKMVKAMAGVKLGMKIDLNFGMQVVRRAPRTGEEHIVLLTESGFLYKDEHYSSLSAAAQNASGTPCRSGNDWFNLASTSCTEVRDSRGKVIARKGMNL